MENEGKLTFDSLEDIDQGWELLDDETFSADSFKPADTTPPEEEAEDLGDDPGNQRGTFDDLLGDQESDSEEDNEEDNEGSDDIYSFLGQTLSEKGIINVDKDKEFKSDEDIYESVQNTIKNGIDSWKNSLGETSLKYIEYLESGGDPATFIEFNATPDYSRLDLSNEDNQKKVISEFYKAKGFSEDKVQKLVETAEDQDELEEEAAEAQKFFEAKRLKDEQYLIEAQKSQEKARRESQEKFNTSVQEFISKTEEVKNFPLKSKKEKEDLKSYIFDKTVPFRTPDGNTIKVSQYAFDRYQRSLEEDSKLEDVVFDALVLKYGLTPVERQTISDRNRKLADLANKHRNKSTSAKLSGSGGKGSRTTQKSTQSFDDWEDF